jgi:hypothetical protein
VNRLLNQVTVICIDIGQKPVVCRKKEVVMKKVIEIIANISAFSGLSPGQLEEVRQIAVKGISPRVNLFFSKEIGAAVSTSWSTA